MREEGRRKRKLEEGSRGREGREMGVRGEEVRREGKGYEGRRGRKREMVRERV